MRCFEVFADGVREGLPLVIDPYPHVPVGEEGRGRKLARFPVGRRLAEALNGQGRILRADVLRTREKGTLLLIEEHRPEDRRALVLVAIAAGYRGGTEWTAFTFNTRPCPNRGKVLPFAGEVWGGACTRCGAPLAYQGQSLYAHPEAGDEVIYDPFPGPGITVLAEGFCAQGIAGRMGGHAERLLILEPGARFRVVRHGRLYGAPAERIVAWDGEILRVGTADEIDPSAGVDEDGDLV